MLKVVLNNPFFNALSNVKAVLDFDQKKRAVIMIGLLLVNAAFDVLGLATIMGLIKSALESDSIIAATYVKGENISDLDYWMNSGLRTLYQWMGFDSLIKFLFILSIWLFVILIIKNLISLIIVYIQTRYSYNVALRLNKKMFKHYYDQGYLFIQDSGSGKNVYKIVDIPRAFASGYLLPLFSFTTELAVLIIMGLALLYVQPYAVLMLLLVIAPTFIGVYSFTKNRVKRIGEKRNIASPKVYGTVLESLKGYVDIKLGNLEQYAIEKFDRTIKIVYRMDTLHNGIYQKINHRMNDIVFGLGILVIFGFTYFTNAEPSSVVSILTFFGVAAYRFLPSINRMLNGLLSIKNYSYLAEELKDLSHKKLEPFKEVEPLTFNKEIRLENIQFVYPNYSETVLDNFSLTIKKGQTVGIVGGSGSGKSTILKLMLRLIRETAGSFYVDNVKLEGEETNARFQKRIGYVEQEVFILNGTLKDNIAFGVENVDEDRLQQAIKDAMLTEFVETSKEGLDMPLGESGVKLSGGQKQRVGIARALYKQAEVLLFDEATSALDGATEKAIVESINHLSNLDKTIVIVAHRITTLEKCDRIIELKEGKISREPNYSELIQEMVLNH